MGRRGDSRFRRLDVLRAVKAARDSGLSPGMVEIEAKDGSVIRVYDKGASEPETPESAGAKGWQDQIEKLKAKARSKEKS